MLKLQAILSGFSSRVDKSAGVRFTTQELTPSELAQLQELNGTFGWLLFSENQIMTHDIPREDAEDKNKTISKRIRSVMFVWWKQLGAHGDFEAFYREKGEKIIDSIKGKLD